MKVMVIVKATKSSEAGEMPSEQLLTEMGAYNERLVKAGIMQAGEGLHPSSKGKRVRFSGEKRTVLDGPFAETKELIAGFWLWTVQSMDEAVEWVKKCPNPMNEDSDIEIRQVFTADDFGAVFTPELREQEASIRAQSLGLGEPRFENAPERVVAGLNEKYTTSNKIKIGAQWDRFVKRLESVPGQRGKDSYGVSWNVSGDGGFDYLTGVELDLSASLPADFVRVTLPAGRYIVFGHRGPVNEIAATFETIWGKWIPECGLKIASSPCYERYTDQFDMATGEGMDIWIALES